MRSAFGFGANAAGSDGSGALAAGMGAGGAASGGTGLAAELAGCCPPKAAASKKTGAKTNSGFMSSSASGTTLLGRLFQMQASHVHIHVHHRAVAVAQDHNVLVSLLLEDRVGEVIVQEAEVFLRQNAPARARVQIKIRSAEVGLDGDVLDGAEAVEKLDRAVIALKLHRRPAGIVNQEIAHVGEAVEGAAAGRIGVGAAELHVAVYIADDHAEAARQAEANFRPQLDGMFVAGVADAHRLAVGAGRIEVVVGAVDAENALHVRIAVIMKTVHGIFADDAQLRPDALDLELELLRERLRENLVQPAAMDQNLNPDLIVGRGLNRDRPDQIDQHDLSEAGGRHLLDDGANIFRVFSQSGGGGEQQGGRRHADPTGIARHGVSDFSPERVAPRYGESPYPRRGAGKTRI